MIFKFGNSSYSSKQIYHINATFSEDRKNMLGICRITDLEIECDENIPYQIKTKIETQLFNYFADKEYIIEDSNWQEYATNDIANYTDVSNITIIHE